MAAILSWPQNVDTNGIGLVCLWYSVTAPTQFINLVLKLVNAIPADAPAIHQGIGSYAIGQLR